MFDRNSEDFVYELVSKNIKRLRREKGLTQEQFAEKLNYSTQFIANIESKNHQTFSLGTLWRMSLILGVEVKEFFREDQIKTDN